MRDYVRNHLEMDDEELPDGLLNRYLQDGFDASLAMDNRWPRQEKIWQVSKVINNTSVTLPPDSAPNTIMSVIGQTGYRLAYMNHENAEDLFSPTTMVATGAPIYWSYWDGQMYLWPTPEVTTTYDLTVRGYRQPVWSDAASTVPDIDPRLHQAICYYAMSLSYAAQEDEILEGVYMARWNRDVAARMKAILEPTHHRPLVLHGGAPVGGVSPYVVNLPPPNWDP
jgi:hypothetical protein